jgi:hypothetical protein
LALGNPAPLAEPPSPGRQGRSWCFRPPGFATRISNFLFQLPIRVFGALGTSLKTTNCPESINALVGQRTDKVDRWRTSDQKQHWLAAALLHIEPRLRRIKGYRSLPLLRAALQAEIREKQTTVRFLCNG